MSDARIIRERQSEASNTLDRSAPASRSCADAIVVQTYTKDAYPVAAASFFACHPITIVGSEDEGATPTFTPDTDTTAYVLNCGGAIPPSGTKLVAHLVGGRWTVRFDG